MLGGGIFCENAVIRNCQILDNFAGLNRGFGGGIYCRNTTISSCDIRGNRVLGDGSAAGAGISASVSGSISDCSIEGNSANAAFEAAGGGISAGFVSVRNCIFLNNTAQAFAGGSARGGGLWAADQVSDCSFVGNRAIASGGERGQGGAVYGGWQTFNMTRCTVIVNSASGGMDPVGGVFVFAGGPVTSTIMAWNEGLPCAGEATLSCCDVFENTLGDTICGVDGGGNFSADPQFCAADPVASRSFTLQEDSPCAPGRHPDEIACGTIGASQVGCGTVLIETRTWSEIKSMYR